MKRGHYHVNKQVLTKIWMGKLLVLVLSVDLILARFIDPVIKVNLMNIVKRKFLIDSNNFYILICNYFDIT
jgi:hypothetical protein